MVIANGIVNIYIYLYIYIYIYAYDESKVVLRAPDSIIDNQRAEQEFARLQAGRGQHRPTRH